MHSTFAQHLTRNIFETQYRMSDYFISIAKLFCFDNRTRQTLPVMLTSEQCCSYGCPLHISPSGVKKKSTNKSTTEGSESGAQVSFSVWLL